MPDKYKMVTKRVKGSPNDDPVCKTKDPSKNQVEEDMVELIDQLSLFKQLTPKLKIALSIGDTKGMLAEGESLAAMKLLDLMSNARSETVQLNACKELLYMRGFKPIDKSAILGLNTDAMTDAELTSQINALMRGEEGVEVDDEEEAAKATKQ